MSNIQKTNHWNIPQGQLCNFPLFGIPGVSTTEQPVYIASAKNIMRELNPHALIGLEDGLISIIEDCRDSEEDNRWYRLWYKSTTDGKHAHAYCVSNPWDRERPNAGKDYRKCHCADDGFLCIGSQSDRGEPVQQSAFSLRDAVLKARYWCTGFSLLMESGTFPQPDDVQ